MGIPTGRLAIARAICVYFKCNIRKNMTRMGLLRIAWSWVFKHWGWGWNSVQVCVWTPGRYGPGRSPLEVAVRMPWLCSWKICARYRFEQSTNRRWRQHLFFSYHILSLFFNRQHCPMAQSIKWWFHEVTLVPQQTHHLWRLSPLGASCGVRTGWQHAKQVCRYLGHPMPSLFTVALLRTCESGMWLQMWSKTFFFEECRQPVGFLSCRGILFGETTDALRVTELLSMAGSHIWSMNRIWNDYPFVLLDAIMSPGILMRTVSQTDKACFDACRSSSTWQHCSFLRVWPAKSSVLLQEDRNIQTSMMAWCSSCNPICRTVVVGQAGLACVLTWT